MWVRPPPFAPKFFSHPFWRGPKSNLETIFEVSLVGHERRFKVKEREAPYQVERTKVQAVFCCAAFFGNVMKLDQSSLSDLIAVKYRSNSGCLVM